ncbi:sulfite exporter TauE/SafE family protein [Flavobacterium soyangense]|uniref:Probable membrane transporter protein n=1 Tax=Flavobacterium soyangense TaxID=2023265 RepID=A0A930XTQ3_9FLAO|nr:sulfite exporter TauE/SafE family protein [Flavobacterium soyangense]MBF2707730.1 sulfite exporter TauE/SafE family protein [Flavobacterium soyangense]
MDLVTFIILFLAAIVGSSLNAVAGGGGFISYPSLIFCNIPLINANGISTVALWPGNITSAIAYKKDIKLSVKFILYFIIVISVGGFVGAYLFLNTTSEVFSNFVPFFLLFTWLLFVFSNKLRNYFSTNTTDFSFVKPNYLHIVCMFFIGIYGGYFGAGLGMIILTAFSLIGLKNLNEMNGIKVILVSFNNGIAAFAYIFSGIVTWQYTLVMLAGALIGGFYGAKLTRQIKQETLRYFIILIGAIITVIFFYKRFFS